MRTIITMAIAAAAIATGLMAAPAFAVPVNMTVSGATNPPIGHYEFCKTAPSECAAIGADHGPAVLTREGWRKILEVNYEVNQAVVPMTDMELHGVEEIWSYPDAVGDCEDYVLLKRRKLIESGFSPADLLITVVLQPNGDGHAVLTVRTDRGDFILDNMRSKVLLWSDTEYTYLKRQSSEHAGRWVKLQDGRAIAVGSVSAN
ncbi:transglutaminase-like cysteine peptidase [Sinorhizobium medicae]|uniref:transglutaminase-like cysteine peptidase n=1 Tax=Sinorhizobium medicae TaxID=110321 RepID=UPI000C7C2278|nr:transglutaminase-like cysteine peptidase [Sinorhizobium medicae]MDX0450049.1 transglutaminase [Sinorhizobium medicae]MDX0553301.1 transglutaminase [Sinorhizobium medicae]MDX0567874.1 transglutaminase [Sinorhizobium medicae]MDX0580468.1 transglutaminase [Sinorhizobium medicae]MDX0703710.1 transglutaminase [Sinorhizobium medicae]